MSEQDLSELLTVDDAAAVLEVTPEQVRAMAEQDLLPVQGAPEALRFRRADVLAARNLGG